MYPYKCVQKNMLKAWDFTKNKIITKNKVENKVENFLNKYS